ncbi:thiamine pyrophosphate-dependent enzyme [Methylocapsa sp. S129]|uniref:thiamine pyrophosphate-dependent enzyme n=1 Tax=Methylocapsa sp. S129 TaxID=1641869 RepID=UPI00131D183E|nr:thiamine pyrophosphate-dependent enzyme [Methylocapsa sp. S129]
MPDITPKTLPGETMSGGMAIASALIANGVDTVFGLPGAQMYPFFDALQQRSDRIRTIGARHEQACGYMAFGYARSTGRPGVFSVVPGPGVLNASAALCTALGCNAPVLCVTGQVPTPFIGRGRGHLHELPDQLATLRGFVKWAARIERAADAPRVIDEAFRQMLSGRPGPVAVEMAWDVMAGSEFVTPLPRARIEPALAPSPQDIEAAAHALVAARQPMIMVGGGAQHASEAVLALAEELGAPVAAFRGGRGIVAEDHALGLSSYAAFRLWPQVDVLIGIGSRLEMPYMRWSGMMKLIDRPPAPPHLIRIDIDASEMHRLAPHTPVVADSAVGARALLDAVKRLRAQKTDSMARPDRAPISTAKAEAASAIRKVQPQMDYLDVIRAALPRDGLLAEELSQVGFASYFGYPVYEPRTYVSCGYQGTLGFGFQTALGVKAAHPGKPVVSITGDGGFMFGVQELATAAQYNIGLVTLLFNNNAFGNVLRDQRIGFGNRVIGAALENPDFMLLARAFGVEGHRVASPAALAPVLEQALKSDRPVLIEIVVAQGSEVSPWEFIHPTR